MKLCISNLISYEHIYFLSYIFTTDSTIWCRWRFLKILKRTLRKVLEDMSTESWLFDSVDVDIAITLMTQANHGTGIEIGNPFTTGNSHDQKYMQVFVCDLLTISSNMDTFHQDCITMKGFLKKYWRHVCSALYGQWCISCVFGVFSIFKITLWIWEHINYTLPWRVTPYWRRGDLLNTSLCM